jgi:NAD(P)-dependent dehydrogenase (short-subunit alcohol dehydrogenase family)
MTEKKTALVTGANKGIGHEIARRLGKLGFQVWLGCRDEQRGEAAAAALVSQGLDAKFLPLDVASDASVRAAAERLAGETGHLDVLVNNAGIAGSLGSPPLEETVEQVKALYEVNVFGPMRVTLAFLSLLKAAPAARVVMMSSELGSLGALTDPGSEFYPYNFLGYNTSKTALNAATVFFAKVLAADGIKVNAADPGYTATDLNGNSGYRTVEQAAEVAVQLAADPTRHETAGYFNHNGVVAW